MLTFLGRPVKKYNTYVILYECLPFQLRHTYFLYVPFLKILASFFQFMKHIRHHVLSSNRLTAKWNTGIILQVDRYQVVITTTNYKMELLMEFVVIQR